MVWSFVQYWSWRPVRLKPHITPWFLHWPHNKLAVKVTQQQVAWRITYWDSSMSVRACTPEHSGWTGMARKVSYIDVVVVVRYSWRSMPRRRSWVHQCSTCHTAFASPVNVPPAAAAANHGLVFCTSISSQAKQTFYHGFFFFFRPLISELAKRNSTKIGHIVGSRPKCNLKTHVQSLGYPLPYKSGVQNHLFRRLRNSIATLAANIFEIKHDIYNRAYALQTTRGLLYRLKTWTLLHKRL